MGLRARGIPIELWQRLAALDARCDFEIRRKDANQKEGTRLTSGFNYERQWVVRIWPRGEPDKAVSCYFDPLEPTLRKAVEMAEGMGWNRPAWHLVIRTPYKPPRRAQRRRNRRRLTSRHGSG